MLLLFLRSCRDAHLSTCQPTSKQVAENQSLLDPSKLLSASV